MWPCGFVHHHFYGMKITYWDKSFYALSHCDSGINIALIKKYQDIVLMWKKTTVAEILPTI